MTIKPYKAPDFSLTNSAGEVVTLADFASSWLVVYFYPKDNTPGCTAEACGIRDARDELADMGVQVVGISKDDASSHEKFKAKYSLNFNLLSDTGGKTAQSYGAWGGGLLGRAGVLRKTYVIDPSGQVVKVYDKVTPLGHGKQLIKDISRLQQA